MKKISPAILAALCINTSICSTALADTGSSTKWPTFSKFNLADDPGKTEGNYFGVNLLRSSVKFHETGTRDTSTTTYVGPNYSDSNYGFGFSYKYAFNFNNVFIAPGVFFEKPNATARSYTSPNSMTVRTRYGAGVDLGYDVTDRIAPYLTGGFSEVGYTATNYTSVGGNRLSAVKQNTVMDWYYGAGIKTKVTKDFSIGLEYNMQRFAAKTSDRDTQNYNGTYKTKLDILKLGVFYNF